MYIFSCKGYQFLVIAYYDLSSWIKIKPLRIFFSWTITDFLRENVICRHSCFGKLVIDRRSKNKDAIAKLAQKYQL